MSFEPREKQSIVCQTNHETHASLTGVKSAMKAKGKLQKASKRASETSEQTVHRQQQHREHMASMRATETSEQTVHRQQQNREHMAGMRATETSEQTVHRKQQSE